MEAGDEHSIKARGKWQQQQHEDGEMVGEEEDGGDEEPAFRKSAHIASSSSSVQQHHHHRNYRRHSPSLSRSSSPLPPEAGGKRDWNMSPGKPEGNEIATENSRKARRLEDQNDAGKDEASRSRHGAREPSSSDILEHDKRECNARGRQQYENQDHGFVSRYIVADRRYHADSRQENPRVDKERDLKAGSDRWKDSGGERNRSRDHERVPERDSYGKSREQHDWGRSRDKERDRGRERYQDKEKDRERGRESNYGGREYFGSGNGIRRDKEKDKDREKSRAYSSASSDIDELQDRDKYGTRFDYRGRDYRLKNAQKESERDRMRYKDDRKQKELDHGERNFVSKEGQEREKLKVGDEDVASPEYSGEHYAQGKEKLSGARVSHVSTRGGLDDRYRNSRNDSAERSTKEVYSSEKKEWKSKFQVPKDHLMDEFKVVPKSAGDAPDRDNKRSEPKQVSTSKVLSIDVKSLKSSKWGPEAQLKSGNASESGSAENMANDLSTTRLAALKAAELVNKNLGVAGFMSVDQKKKLLWGSKAIPEKEPGAAAGTNIWDTVHFQDRDRQEKFNKLMGVKAETKADSSSAATHGASLFAEEKQRELQQDLEKQFTAGLRRRDGRTVGLGL